MPFRFRVKRNEVERLRVHAGLSGRAAAHKLGVSATHLNLIERGERQPSPKLLKAMADLYGVPITDLYDEVVDEGTAA